MRLGILGGTFNPIHLGHLLLAESAREQYRLDQVWFMPAATPPHKSARRLVDGPHRLAMARLAVRAHPAFRASDLELKLGGVSYSVRTVRMIRARHPTASLFFIVGADMLSVPWVGLDELSSLCRFVVARRAPSGGASHHRHAHPAAHTPNRLAVHHVDMPPIEISSSMIRRRVRQGRSIRYLVPDAVAQYIGRHRLYRTQGVG